MPRAMSPSEASGTVQPTNYWDYIRVEELLALQTGLAEDEAGLENDEVLFITVHQIYELWFKLVLRELRSLRDLFHRDPVQEQELSSAVRGIQRIVTILRRCQDHFQVIETLTTREYLGFRDKLMPASGFQSAQMRQIEILMGLSDAERIPLGLEESYEQALKAHDGSISVALQRVQAQKRDLPTLASAVEEWLHRTPFGGRHVGEPDAEATLERFVAGYVAAQSGEIDRSRELALARAFTAGDRERLSARYEEEKTAIHAFLHPSEAEGGPRPRCSTA